MIFYALWLYAQQQAVTYRYVIHSTAPSGSEYGLMAPVCILPGKAAWSVRSCRFIGDDGASVELTHCSKTGDDWICYASEEERDRLRKEARKPMNPDTLGRP